jgi:ferredoxin
MKVRINKDLCLGTGTCVEICPELFSMDGDTAIVKVGRVPESLADICLDAAEACPAFAIILFED